MYFHEIFKMGCCHDSTFKFVATSLCFSDASRLWGCGICIFSTFAYPRDFYLIYMIYLLIKKLLCLGVHFL